MHARKRQIDLLIPALLTLALMMTGCANSDAKQGAEAEAKSSLESSVEKVEAALVEGRTDDAVKMLKALASRFPADKTPWLRIAQIRFDAGDYSDAIINAQEAIKRDPSEKGANSILTLSSLRLATKSLSDLRSQNALNGSIKSDAQDLTRTLREITGVAPVSVPGKPAAAAPPRGKMVRKTAPAPASDVGSGSGPNPFINLK